MTLRATRGVLTSECRRGARRYRVRKLGEVFELLNNHLHAMLQANPCVVENVKVHLDRLTAGRSNSRRENMSGHHIGLDCAARTPDRSKSDASRLQSNEQVGRPAGEKKRTTLAGGPSAVATACTGPAFAGS